MSHEQDSVKISLARFVGRIERETELFAASVDVLPSQLTGWLGTVLLNGRAPIREVLGPSYSMQNVRREATKTLKRKQSKMALAVSSSGTRTRKMAGISKMKAYWSKMTPEQRSAEVKRRMKKWK